MIAKYSKKIGKLILIVASLFNIMGKLVNKISLNKEMIYSAMYMQQQEQQNSSQEHNNETNKTN